jgi:hypothetical protein
MWSEVLYMEMKGGNDDQPAKGDGKKGLPGRTVGSFSNADLVVDLEIPVEPVDPQRDDR